MLLCAVSLDSKITVAAESSEAWPEHSLHKALRPHAPTYKKKLGERPSVNQVNKALTVCTSFDARVTKYDIDIIYNI